LWFKHAYARVPKGFLLHPIIFFSDGTVCGRMNGRNVHAMFAANVSAAALTSPRLAVTGSAGAPEAVEPQASGIDHDGLSLRPTGPPSQAGADAAAAAPAPACQ